MKTELWNWIREMYPKMSEEETEQCIMHLIKKDVLGDTNALDDFLVEKGTAIPVANPSYFIPDKEWQDVHPPKDLVSFRQIIVGVDEEKGTINVYYLFKKEPQPKFKPGDKVRVTERIRYWIKKIGWEPSMKDVVGRTDIIQARTTHEEYESPEQTGQPCWGLKEIFGSWPEDCLELVE